MEIGEFMLQYFTLGWCVATWIERAKFFPKSENPKTVKIIVAVVYPVMVVCMLFGVEDDG